MKLLMITMIMSASALISNQARAQQGDGGGSGCPPASITRNEINAIMKSDKLSKAHKSAGEFLSSYFTEIKLIIGSFANPNHVATYQVKTTLSDGSEPMTFLVTVAGARGCGPESAAVISATVVPNSPAPAPLINY